MIGHSRWLTLPCPFPHKRARPGTCHRNPVLTSSMPFASPDRATGRMLLSGGVSRVAKGADCKSAVLSLRRFESFFPHHRFLTVKSSAYANFPRGKLPLFLTVLACVNALST